MPSMVVWETSNQFISFPCLKLRKYREKRKHLKLIDQVVVYILNRMKINVTMEVSEYMLDS